MTRLEEKLERAREGAAEKLPEEALATSQEHSRELEASGLADRAVGEGDRAPDFALPSTAGDELRLADVVSRGPVVLSFYRGRW